MLTHTAASPAKPRSPIAHAFLDFDGTITTRDVLDELIVRFAVDDSWRGIELAWQRGEIGSFDCLRREFDLIRVDAPTLDAFLDRIGIDPGAAALFATLRRHGVPFTILSDGVESFIRRILSRLGEGDVAVRSNRIEHAGDRLTLVCPHRDAACVSESAHCKCASATRLSPAGAGSTIYVGDGRSDRCASRTCDVVFAKGVLATLLAEEGRPFVPFRTLADVAAYLDVAWDERRATA